LIASVLSPDGGIIASQRIGKNPTNISHKTTAEGWHTISVTGSGFSATALEYELEVEYWGQK
jgi:hypothetical protein